MLLRKSVYLATLLASCSVTYAFDFTGNDWKYNFQGHYNVANVNTTNNGLVGNVLGSIFNLNAQLNLISGTTSASNYGTSITQSSLGSISVNDLQTNVNANPGLVSGLGSFVFNLLDFSDGVYVGNVSGTNVALTRGSLLSADLFAMVDTRVLGTGVVLDLRAAIPTAALNGTLTGTDAGYLGAFGDRANYVTGTSGLMQTITLQARARAFAANITTLDTGYLNVGAIDNFADQWDLSRQPVPEPASMAIMGMGITAFIARRKRRKSA